MTPADGIGRQVRARWVIALLASSVLAGAFAGEATPSHTTRQDLLGAWRLVRIEVTGPAGAEIDPFYGDASTGLLVYDPSGWFSVQIESPPRPSVAAPARRPEATLTPGAARRKAAALDSYYAYFGTWEYDPVAATVTHHAQGSAYPNEGGATYMQSVRVEGNRMTFTRSQGTPAHPTVQTKVWERLAGP